MAKADADVRSSSIVVPQKAFSGVRSSMETLSKFVDAPSHVRRIRIVRSSSTRSSMAGSLLGELILDVVDKSSPLVIEGSQ